MPRKPAARPTPEYQIVRASDSPAVQYPEGEIVFDYHDPARGQVRLILKRSWLQTILNVRFLQNMPGGAWETGVCADCLARGGEGRSWNSCSCSDLRLALEQEATESNVHEGNYWFSVHDGQSRIAWDWATAARTDIERTGREAFSRTIEDLITVAVVNVLTSVEEQAGRAIAWRVDSLPRTKPSKDLFAFYLAVMAERRRTGHSLKKIFARRADAEQNGKRGQRRKATDPKDAKLLSDDFYDGKRIRHVLGSPIRRRGKRPRITENLTE
jgi:hypothetical protein